MLVSTDLDVSTSIAPRVSLLEKRQNHCRLQSHSFYTRSRDCPLSLFITERNNKRNPSLHNGRIFSILRGKICNDVRVYHYHSYGIFRISLDVHPHDCAQKNDKIAFDYFTNFLLPVFQIAFY